MNSNYEISKLIEKYPNLSKKQSEALYDNIAIT